MCIRDRPDTDPMILLQDVCHAMKSGGEDGQHWGMEGDLDKDSDT